MKITSNSVIIFINLIFLMWEVFGSDNMARKKESSRGERPNHFLISQSNLIYFAYAVLNLIDFWELISDSSLSDSWCHSFQHLGCICKIKAQARSSFSRARPIGLWSVNIIKNFTVCASLSTTVVVAVDEWPFKNPSFAWSLRYLDYSCHIQLSANYAVAYMTFEI